MTTAVIVRAGAERGERLRSLGIAMLAGAIAGVLVGGIGGRIAMRISGALGGASVAGMRTENGNIVGDFTLDGTLFLVLYVGISQGVYGGLLYFAIRPWLARFGAAAGLAFGILLLATFGPTAIRSGNPDFRLFGPALVNVLSFAALFVLFGLALVPIVERLGRLERGTPTSVLVVGSAVIGLLIFAITNVAVLPALVLGLRGIGPSAAVDFGRSLLLLDALLMLALVARRFEAVRGRNGLSYALLAAPAVVGAVLTVGQILAILL